MKLQDLSLENRFLVNCLRLDFDKSSQYFNSIVFSELNWETILKKATSLSIAPLLSYAIQKTYTSFPVPEFFKASLNSTYQEALKRNLFIYHIVDRIIKSFRNKDVAFLFMRGPVLGENLYPNIALRSMADLDILIKQEAYQKADEILCQLGYQIFAPFHTFQKIYMNKDNKISLDIELHFDLDPKLEKNPEEIWKNTCSTRVNDTDVLMLKPELLLEHLLTHLDKHIKQGKTKLIWFSDIHRIIKHYGKDMDWNYFLDKTEKNKVQKPVYEILSIIKEWFTVSLPAFVTDRIKSAKCSYSEKDIFDPHPTRKQITYIASIPKIQGFFNKVYYILKVTFPDKRLMIKFYSKDQKDFTYFFYFYRLYKMSIVVFNTILRKFKCSLRH